MHPIKNTVPEPSPHLFLTVEEAMLVLRFGRESRYKEINVGEFKTSKVVSQRCVPVAMVEKCIEERQAERQNIHRSKP